MSCCKKAKQIMQGHIRSFWGSSIEVAKIRKPICITCDKVTYYSLFEYMFWLVENGIDIVKNFEELEKLEPLKIQPYAAGRYRFCSICKCPIEEKVLVEDEKCPLGKW